MQEKQPPHIIITLDPESFYLGNKHNLPPSWSDIGADLQKNASTTKELLAQRKKDLVTEPEFIKKFEDELERANTYAITDDLRELYNSLAAVNLIFTTNLTRDWQQIRDEVASKLDRVAVLFPKSYGHLATYAQSLKLATAESFSAELFKVALQLPMNNPSVNRKNSLFIMKEISRILVENRGEPEVIAIIKAALNLKPGDETPITADQISDVLSNNPAISKDK